MWNKLVMNKLNNFYLFYFLLNVYFINKLVVMDEIEKGKTIDEI